MLIKNVDIEIIAYSITEYSKTAERIVMDDLKPINCRKSKSKTLSFVITHQWPCTDEQIFFKLVSGRDKMAATN